jgi:hypothetical protein
MVINLTRDRVKNSQKLFCVLASKELEESIGEVQNIEHIVSYFVMHNIIRQSIINRYVIIKLYPEYIERFEKKDRAVNELSKILPLEPTAIYNILSNHYAYFFPMKLDFFKPTEIQTKKN